MFQRWPLALTGAFCLALLGSGAAWSNVIETAKVHGNCNEFSVDVTGTHLRVGHKYDVKWTFDITYPDGSTITYHGKFPVHSDDANGDFSTRKPYDWKAALADGKYMFDSGTATLYDATEHAKRNTISIEFNPGAFSCPNIFSNLCRSKLLNYGIFGMGGKMSFTNDTINGDVGIASGGSLANNAPSTINGNVYEYSDGQISGPGNVTGQIIVDPKLVQKQYDTAVEVATDAANLTVNDGTYDGITNTTTVTGSAGLNVVAITGDISLSGTQSLTLSGPPDAYFVVNVSGGLNITGTSSLLLSGGVTDTHVLWNFTGSNAHIQPRAQDVVNGIILAAGSGANLELDGTYYGTVIAGGAIAVNSGAVVNSVPCPKHACTNPHVKSK